MGKILKLKRGDMKKPSIRDWVDDTDLRTVTNNFEFLRHVQEEYGLRPGEMVVYSNRKFDGWRFVINMGGMLLAAQPPRDPESRLSLFIAVGQFLIDNFGMKAKQKKRFRDKADKKAKRSKKFEVRAVA